MTQAQTDFSLSPNRAKLDYYDMTLRQLRAGTMTPSAITALGYTDAPSAIAGIQAAQQALLTSPEAAAADIATDLASRRTATAALNAQAIATADSIDTLLAQLGAAFVTYQGQLRQIAVLRVVNGDSVSNSISPDATSAAACAGGLAPFFSFMGTPGNATLGSRARTYLKP